MCCDVTDVTWRAVTVVFRKQRVMGESSSTSMWRDWREVMTWRAVTWRFSNSAWWARRAPRQCDVNGVTFCDVLWRGVSETARDGRDQLHVERVQGHGEEGHDDLRPVHGHLPWRRRQAPASLPGFRQPGLRNRRLQECAMNLPSHIPVSDPWPLPTPPSPPPSLHPSPLTHAQEVPIYTTYCNDFRVTKRLVTGVFSWAPYVVCSVINS